MNPTQRTIILLGALTALLVIVGYFISGTGGALIFLILGIIMNVGSYWFSDKIALSMAGAKPLSSQQAPAIYQDVGELCQRMGLPMPKLYYTEDAQPNAFATGRNPENSAVVITRGLLNVLNRDEVRGVLAHELGHIKNRDVLISTIAAVMAGAISSLANLALFFGGNDREDRNPIAELLFVLLSPIAATLIQLAVSRSREFQADATAAQYTQRPQDLANALMKIDQASQQIPFVDANPALSTLYISNPFRTDAVLNLFSTHPPIAQRIERLMSMQK